MSRTSKLMYTRFCTCITYVCLLVSYISAGMSVIGETILQVIAARGLKSMTPPPNIELTVAPEAIRYFNALLHVLLSNIS